ncbi:hypothetical protein EC957_008099 [Mortierella hygrophila]|uniref:Uncharacterized protein n=1 Tax=Mortierella hygrophila TaxID=979708 RepID=A0A9P6JXP9_9FUNG|nr:hypothetical protein EC957_008099 [Mortierella hygrophila]
MSKDAAYRSLEKELMESRRSFADYMAERHWTVRDVATEADLGIAIDANPGDIISCYSGMLAYESITRLYACRCQDRGIATALCTVESPRQISKASGTSSQHQPGIPQKPTFTSDLENQGLPTLPRTRIPRHSQRYSFKRH